jgi:hypothetical protein
MKEALATIAELSAQRNNSRILAADKMNEDIREITKSLIDSQIEGPVYHWESIPIKDEYGQEISSISVGLCWNGEKILHCFDPDGDPTIDWASDGRPLLGESIDIRLSMRKALDLLLDNVMDKLNKDISDYEGNYEN